AARPAAEQEAALMRGRHPAGPEYVDQLDGSTLARERLKVVLQTLAGQCRVAEACERLGICEQRFHQIREEALRAAVAALEPRPQPRPAAQRSRPPPGPPCRGPSWNRSTTGKDNCMLRVCGRRSPCPSHSPPRRASNRPSRKKKCAGNGGRRRRRRPGATTQR